MASDNDPPKGKDPLFDSPAKLTPPSQDASKANSREAQQEAFQAIIARNKDREVRGFEHVPEDARGTLPSQNLPTHNTPSDNRSHYRARELGESRAPNPATGSVSRSTEHGRTMNVHHANLGEPYQSAEHVFSRDAQEKSTKTVESALSQNGQENTANTIKDRTQEAAASQQHSQSREKVQEKGKDHER